MASLSIRNVRKVYSNGADILKGINLEIQDGEFLILVGGSGCGKSTLLNMIAGLETVSEGGIYIGDKCVNDVPPKSRDIAMVFQSYALYPTMTVRENISFGLGIRKVPAAEQKKIVDRVAETLQMTHLLDRKPAHLSGGQRQRVAMGRAIARNPSLFLFDEPLSNLDAKLRVEMRAEIKLMHQRLGTTTVYVTHDQVEAMTLGDKIAVMKDGVVQQFGSPQEIYDQPSNMFVAGFIGSPSMNFLRGQLISHQDGLAFTLNHQGQTTALPLPAPMLQQLRQSYQAGNDIVLGIRPEHVTDAISARHSETVHDYKPTEVDCTIELTEPTGPDTLVFSSFNQVRTTCRAHPRAFAVPGQAMRLAFDLSQAVFFDPVSEQRLA
ncbi:ABC transporter ATP-binding protein [Undibacterium oligocarboniphilum]|uniref:sn-glycerol-3-phosphate ABC transporter ATP-binding protein UgpC n=1 Tax=Undibacterium oligocarboniphilum TaxID=666702 RepID=A0A850QEC3_9BURK|nr:sn-glycerol-3-phosphate ABC transporter ATP-binding protein UgpC [Undibacterium oligocarboniphilum]MBC3869553.1 sn-glycerol-3-phosphate ABC transporter ATP-binding protein UgpC [Undibacterium oligocarboniphilum]NVO77931.1 sn-glycerol-3-phosphate ABC transporter ATP-binding protein UgpC [Undibacterium oligocarboniphilum]